MICQCCDNHRHRVSVVQSNLIQGSNLMLCNDCKRQGHEPRHFIVIAAHSGIDVKDKIRNRTYCGEELEAREVIF